MLRVGSVKGDLAFEIRARASRHVIYHVNMTATFADILYAFSSMKILIFRFNFH